ncbi:phage tail protein [Novosphingobium sp. FSY-8]|uniref:Phage tail protein n=1 Tax=Novosphingobium ovatum TaxID=1908523 RepID=A0ABW9XAJ8_9SPHN|nr:phage tail sheath subtilisin-like domain-containing protein [Novosphingobium ovatum]NBC35537.1 phage tail protein [Novosphingobium ovatum]
MTHGLTLTESATSARTTSPVSMSTIGIIATATAAAGAATTALDAAFPLNTPVLVTDIDAALGNAGTGGTLAPTLEAIGDITTPVLVVVRVAAGETEAATNANVIGGTDGNHYTGIQALLAAEHILGVRPRIIGAPGLDTQEVTAELAIAARRLRGRVYARAIGADAAAVNAYRDEFADRELTLIWPNTGTFVGDATARALALRAMIDETQGYHKTISNVAISGVTGLTHDVHFDLLDPSTEAGVLNSHDIVTLVRYGGGYRYWGNTTCAGADQTEYRFESAVRTLHALQDILISVVFPYFDKPMTVALIKDLLETANKAYKAEKTAGRVMGAKVYFDEDANTSAELAAGRPKFRIEFTPCAPLDNPTVNLNISDIFYTGFADAVNA